MKNRTMRAAALLLSLTLITTCFVGGTFAKYTTKDTGSDSARVAKWGIDVLVSGNLFGQHYNPNNATTGKDLIAASAMQSVDNGANDNKNIVAPGTKNDEGFTVKISGTPEVAYKVTAKTGAEVKDENGDAKGANEDIYLGAGDWGVMVEATGLNAASAVTGLYTENGGTYTVVGDGVKYNADETYYELHDAVNVSADYYPINWKVAEAGDDVADINKTKKLGEIADEMVTNLTNGTTEPSENANDPANYQYILTWEWPFYTDADTDAKDTILGNLQVENNKVVKKGTDGTYAAPEPNDYNLDIVFNFEVVVEQVD